MISKIALVTKHWITGIYGSKRKCQTYGYMTTTSRKSKQRRASEQSQFPIKSSFYVTVFFLENGTIYHSIPYEIKWLEANTNARFSELNRKRFKLWIIRVIHGGWACVYRESRTWSIARKGLSRVSWIFAFLLMECF